MLKYFWPFLAIVIISGVVKISIATYRLKRLKDAGMPEIDQMDGKEFEQYLEILFKKLGFKVKRTPYTGDFGGDLVLEKDSVKTVVQAKRYKKNVGNKAVQEVVAAKAYYKAQAALIVTNSNFTSAAMQLAKANNVELWGREKLVKAILETKKEKSS